MELEQIKNEIIRSVSNCKDQFELEATLTEYLQVVENGEFE